LQLVAFCFFRTDQQCSKADLTINLAGVAPVLAAVTSSRVSPLSRPLLPGVVILVRTVGLKVPFWDPIISSQVFFPQAQGLFLQIFWDKHELSLTLQTLAQLSLGPPRILLHFCEADQGASCMAVADMHPWIYSFWGQLSYAQPCFLGAQLQAY
jgi:hypothetical protein